MVGALPGSERVRRCGPFVPPAACGRLVLLCDATGQAHTFDQFFQRHLLRGRQAVGRSLGLGAKALGYPWLVEPCCTEFRRKRIHNRHLSNFRPSTLQAA
jgi:hypothetical protein